MDYEHYSDGEEQVLHPVNISPYRLQMHVVESWLRWRFHDPTIRVEVGKTIASIQSLRLTQFLDGEWQIPNSVIPRLDR